MSSSRKPKSPPQPPRAVITPGRYKASLDNISMKRGYLFMEMSIEDGRKVEGWLKTPMANKKPSRRRR